MTQAFRISILALATMIVSPVLAQDRLKVAIGQRGVFENSVSELGQDAGIFKKHNLALEILYTQGSGESQQAVISGSVDIGIGIGTVSALSAFQKGAPIRAIGATMKGSYEVWYVPANSPIKTFKDAAGKTVAFSTRGSSTNLLVMGLEKVYGVKVDAVATGSPPATYTQVMSGQIAIGWTAAPLQLDAILDGRTRIVARGSEVPEMREQTVRLIAVNAGSLEKNRDAFRRYMEGYRETLAWLYESPDSMKVYAKWAQTTEEIARRTRDDFIPRANADPDNISGIDQAMADGIAFKYLSEPLKKEQLDQFFQLMKK
ncbi:ABC transporter substrate-binding protein [Roseiarcaceae bacterium H3SJ34-1]|uniref:ABC transporter substrate-binding protein n=1 Tax=Terripilifer ovatus TaxID=3032367 RepID=UPI003AB983DF|nr:ABC transporter substrate-binding protein [Roseiarcaceae bacterium H3SJ34-1]